MKLIVNNQEVEPTQKVKLHKIVGDKEVEKIIRRAIEEKKNEQLPNN